MRLMSLLPYRSLSIHTELTPAEVTARLSEDVTQQRRLFTMQTPAAPYRGVVSADRFELVRQITYRNSFLPVVRGEITSTPNGSRVDVHMRLMHIVFAFMAVWFGGVVVGCITVLPALLTGFELAMLAPYVMLVLGTLFVSSFFGLEAQRAESFLRSKLAA